MADTPYAAGDDDLPRTVRQQKEARARDQMAREILNAPRPSYARDAKAQHADVPGAAPQAHQPPPHQGQIQQGQMLHPQPDPRGAAAVRAADFAQHPLPPGHVPPAVVTRFKVPFFHLMFFFLKCTLAAIPALLLAGAMIYGIGQAAQHYFPWLIKMKILITFP